jgi:hypothetical protein
MLYQVFSIYNAFSILTKPLNNKDPLQIENFILMQETTKLKISFLNTKNTYFLTFFSKTIPVVDFTKFLTPTF